MGAFPIEFQHDLERESWALYALGIVVIALRTFVASCQFCLDQCLLFMVQLCQGQEAWYPASGVR